MKTSLFVLFFIFPIFSTAQQHPLPVESSPLLEPGHARFELGAAHFSKQTFPLSGLSGDLTKIGTVRFNISLSQYVELQTDGTLLNVLHVEDRKPAFNSVRTTAKTTSADIGDFSIWTKFGVLNEYVHGIDFSVRFGVQLPNASNESGLGIDEMNFYSSLLFQKHFAGQWTLNTGLGILSDPTKVGSQHDVLIYGIEYSVPAGEATILMFQTAGRVGHDGISIHRLANGRIGMEKTFGDFTFRFSGVANFSPIDNAKGIELTASYLFHVVEIKK